LVGLRSRARPVSSFSAGEALGAGEADVADEHRVAVEHLHAGCGQDPRHLVGLIRLVVVVSQHPDHRHLRGGQLAGQDLRLVGQPVVGQIPAQGDHVRLAAGPDEQFVEGAARLGGAVQVAHGGDPDRRCPLRHR